MIPFVKQFSQALTVISQHRLLRVLDEGSQQKLAGIANLRDYGAAEVLYQGENATDLWIVVTGEVELVKLTAKGHEFMIELAIPQDLFGAVFYSDNPRYPVTAVALKSGRMLHFPIREMHDLLARNHRFIKEVLADTCLRLCHAQHMRGFTVEDVPKRIGGALVTFLRSSAQKSLKVELLWRSLPGQRSNQRSGCRDNLPEQKSLPPNAAE